MPTGFNPKVMANPQTFRVNDISIGVINADIVKDLCMNLVIKESKEPKIEVALKSILQQRTYYPLYPSNPKSPIDWE